jgi:putative N6-adenine-specific DNA methylase
VCNPPYGVRLERGGTVPKLLGDLGDFLKQKCTGSDALIYVGDKELLKMIGLRPKWRKTLRNGPLDGRLALYQLY